MHVNVETQMSYIVTSERTMSPTGLLLLLLLSEHLYSALSLKISNALMRCVSM